MFEFYDPCESCPVPLDSLSVGNVGITILAAHALMRWIPLSVGVMMIARFIVLMSRKNFCLSNHLLTSSLIYFFGGFCNGKMVCHRYQEESRV